MKPIFLCKSQKIESEVNIDKYRFKVFKFTPRLKPTNKDRILILGCFSEFGCETIGVMYCIPRILRRYPGRYIIGMGWYGREYMYRHLLDEFWEIDEEFMYLRETVNAFRYLSKELEEIEIQAKEYGQIRPTNYLARYAIGNMCNACGFYWCSSTPSERCSKCKNTNIQKSLFSDPKYNREHSLVRLPTPSKETIRWASSIVPKNTVGIFARGRKMYGRNLTEEFYTSLIKLLQSRNFNVIWLGEKQSVQPCPVDGVLDFSRMSESRDLEKALAIVCYLRFTIQFWTASTRLAGMMGVPFLLFESPEQIYHTNESRFVGQEGLRLELTSFGNKKLVISDYKLSASNPMLVLDYVDYAIDDMEKGNYDDIIGLVKDMDQVLEAKNIYEERYGGKPSRNIK